MTRTMAFLMALSLLSACTGGNPLTDSEEDGSTEEETTTDPITGGRTLPPGTTVPAPDSAIVRYEAEDSGGGGYARNISYDSALDVFNVDNLAFDGDNSYRRGGTAGAANTVGQLKSFAVYEADATTVDQLTGNVIGTFNYRALYGRSTSGSSEFAIVRSGSYVGYGFGGFIYQRNATDDSGNDVELVLPTTGDAEYTGDYAGIRVYDGVTGIHYVEGDARLVLDFKDFNDNKTGVALQVRNRRLFDLNGNDVTTAYLDAVQADNSSLTLIRGTDSAGNEVLPTLSPVITPEVADTNGEIVQSTFSNHGFTDGTVTEASTGTYYAIISGTNAEEIIGVAVSTGDNALVDNTTFQETGGFIVYRQ